MKKVLLTKRKLKNLLNKKLTECKILDRLHESIDGMGLTVFPLDAAECNKIRAVLTLYDLPYTENVIDGLRIFTVYYQQKY